MNRESENCEYLAGMLRKGLGRAVLFLKDHPPQEYRETVWHACRNNLLHDRQSEESRGPYLFDVIQATGDAGFYRDALVESLQILDREPSPYQLVQIAERFARDGDEELKNSVRLAFLTFGRATGFSGDEQVIRLYGLTGFRDVVSKYFESGYAAEEYELDGWFEALSEREGEEPAADQISRVAATDSQVFEVWNRIQEYRNAPKPRFPTHDPDETASYDELAAILDSQDSGWRSSASRWARRASGELMERAARDCLAESDPWRLAVLLWVFRRRRFPLDVGGLLPLARHESREVARWAMEVAHHFTDSRVRELGLELIHQPARAAFAIDLFVNNFEPGDYGRFERVWPKLEDEDDIHGFGMGFRSVLRENPSAEAELSLLLEYEMTPCSFCREYVVDALKELGKLPGWMVEECRWDASSRTRALVA